jgi:hypothetical protein
MGVAQADVIVLDALRRQRNLSDYEGDPVSAATLASCLEQAAKLLSHTEDWLARQNPAWRGKAP